VSLLAHMEGVCVTGDANTCARNIADRVKEACDVSMEKTTKGGNGRRPVPWWNEEIGLQVSEKQRTRKPGAKGNNLQSQEKGPEDRDQS